MSTKPGEVTTEKQRTKQQNKAMHLYFRMVAEALNGAGLDMRKVLKPGVPIPWNERMVKEYLWREAQKIRLGKESTRELTTAELDQLIIIINAFLASKGIEMDFPSIESAINRMRLKQ